MTRKPSVQKCTPKAAHELIPMPDFKRTHTTKWVEAQDKATMARLREVKRIQEERDG